MPVFALLLLGCFPRSIRAYCSLYRECDTSIALSPHPQKELKVLYTGCGGLLIHSGVQSVLIDPFYSYKGLSMVWKKLATDKVQADKIFGRIDAQCGGTSAIGTVLIAHSHYDHLMDLPYVLNTHLKDGQVQIIGSASTRNALAAMQLSPYTFRQPRFPKERCYDEIRLSPQMTVKVIPSGHAAHVKFLGIPIQGMRGSIGAGGIKGFDAPGYKAPFYKWKEGEDYSFLLELEGEGGERPFRIFIQSSSCTPPAGIPDFLGQDEPVDLAFIGVASASNVPDYPVTLLRAIRPRYVVFIHWEDFFRSYDLQPEIVRATNFKKFLRRYEQAMGPAYTSFTTMPRQGTLYRFLY